MVSTAHFVGQNFGSSGQGGQPTGITAKFPAYRNLLKLLNSVATYWNPCGINCPL